MYCLFYWLLGFITKHVAKQFGISGDHFKNACEHIDGSVQERCNSIALAMELHLSCTDSHSFENLTCDNFASSNVWPRYFVWRIKGNLWNSTQKYLPHTLNDKFYIIQSLSAFIFKSWKVFLNCCPGPFCREMASLHSIPGILIVL